MNDDQKHQLANQADEDIDGEQSALGSSSASEAEDIDATLESVGLPNDDNGPHELNSEQALQDADKHQE